ncbi:uncharacterized protein LOC129590825 isoform X2 [Paramacrobiotus metropolitanus]|uniref:uncharacterized protein LOC129590825 isoform X2 n=1 Tax=Paramacrobiotus metropolitanus TaxID=2943436 RepID=UPI0024464263|nr:uncharacterized protein LOC129590825 isoform X2 [Paramacrobiotus metropolitanus]
MSKKESQTTGNDGARLFNQFNPEDHPRGKSGQFVKDNQFDPAEHPRDADGQFVKTHETAREELSAAAKLFADTMPRDDQGRFVGEKK